MKAAPRRAPALFRPALERMRHRRKLRSVPSRGKTWCLGCCVKFKTAKFTTQRSHLSLEGGDFGASFVRGLTHSLSRLLDQDSACSSTGCVLASVDISSSTPRFHCCQDGKSTRHLHTHKVTEQTQHGTSAGSQCTTYQHLVTARCNFTQQLCNRLSKATPTQHYSWQCTTPAALGQNSHGVRDCCPECKQCKNTGFQGQARREVSA